MKMLNVQRQKDNSRIKISKSRENDTEETFKIRSKTSTEYCSIIRSETFDCRTRLHRLLLRRNIESYELPKAKLQDSG